MITSYLIADCRLSIVDWRNLQSSIFNLKSFNPAGRADIASQTERALNQLASRRIVTPQLAEVRDYLIRYPDMADILPLICTTASERFEMPAQLSLEVYHDPEIEDEYLTLYIRQEQYDDNIMDVIEEISLQFETALADRSGWLLVSTDFALPK